MNPKVDIFISNAKSWQEEFKKLRSVILDCGLTEELKWGKPCYSFQEKNIVIIQGFKGYCALLFFKGVLLKDTEGILVKTGENTRVGRQIRFSGVSEITEKEVILKSYIHQAVEVEKAGLKFDVKKEKEPLPEELQKKLNKNPELKQAFTKLSPGRKRGYILYIMAAKQSKTRVARVEKCTPQILVGKGYNER